jgi:hypothetical protein
MKTMEANGMRTGEVDIYRPDNVGQILHAQFSTEREAKQWASRKLSSIGWPGLNIDELSLAEVESAVNEHADTCYSFVLHVAEY